MFHLEPIRKGLNSPIAYRTAGSWPSGQCVKFFNAEMKGNNSFHRIRVGVYRIVYEIHEDRPVILIVKIGHRKVVYKKLT